MEESWCHFKSFSLCRLDLLLWIRRIHNVLPVHRLLVVGPFWYIIGILFGWNKDINREQVNVYSCYISATQSNIDRKNISVWDKYNSESKKKCFLSKRNQYWLWFARLSRFRQAGGYKATFSSSAGFVKLLLHSTFVEFKLLWASSKPIICHLIPCNVSMSDCFKRVFHLRYLHWRLMGC